LLLALGVAEPSDSYQFQILSSSLVVINDDLTGPRSGPCLPPRLANILSVYTPDV
jgi:hypothetical protein